MGRPLLSEGRQLFISIYSIISAHALCLAPVHESTPCPNDVTHSRSARRSTSTSSSSDAEVPFVPDSPTVMSSPGRPDPTTTILPSLRADIERLRRAAERIRERARQNGPTEAPPSSDSSTLREAVLAIDRAYSELLDAQRNWPPRGSHPWFGDSGTTSSSIGPAHTALVLEPPVTAPSNPEPESPTASPVFRPPRRRLFSRASPRPTTTVPVDSRMSRSPPQSTRDDSATSLARRLQMRGIHSSVPDTTPQPQVDGARSLLRRMAEVYNGQQHESTSSARRDTIFNLFSVIDVDSSTLQPTSSPSRGTSLTRPRSEDPVDPSDTPEYDGDPSVLRQNRVRRRLNSDEEEATMLSASPEVTPVRSSNAMRLRRARLHDESSLPRPRRGFRLSSLTGDMDFEASDDALRAARADLATAAPGARRRRGWGTIIPFALTFCS